MTSSIVRRAAVGVAAGGFVALATVLPANAAVTNIEIVPSSEEGRPPATLVEYSLDASSPTVDNPCFLNSSFYEEQVTLTVSESGAYQFSDVRDNGLFVPEEYSPETTGRDSEDAFAGVFTGDDCVQASIDDDSFTELDAGTEYVVSLTTSSALQTGDFGYLISHADGSGVATVTDIGAEPEGVSFEQAQAACVPGAAAPAGYNVIDGTSRNETLRGTEGNDLIRGLGGQDTLVGLGGDDILCGGAGQDTLRGGAGEDFLFGEAGQDALYGEADDDVLAGGDGNDFHDGGAGSDVALDTVGSNTFRNVESRTLGPAPNSQPTVTAIR